MRTVSSLHKDLLKLTKTHESECTCVYCRRRRILFGRIIFRNFLIFIGTAVLLAVVIFLAFYAHGDIILIFGGYEFILLAVAVISGFICLAMANALE